MARPIWLILILKYLCNLKGKNIINVVKTEISFHIPIVHTFQTGYVSYLTNYSILMAYGVR